MKRFPRLLAALLSSLLAVCAPAAEKLTVAATPVPHAEILEFIKPTLARQGVELDVKVFTDYVQPNTQLVEKGLDANFFQHKPYLDNFNKERGAQLVPVLGVHVEPFGVYSRKLKSLKDLKAGATVAIPNDPTNGARALLLLEKAGLIKLKDKNDIQASPKNVIDNPKKLVFRELEAALLPRVLDQVDLAAINANYALEAKLVPTRDALAIEGGKSPYVNILVAREDNRNSPALKKLAAALASPEVKKFIAEKYQGAVVPAF